MFKFEYFRPADLNEALSLLDKHNGSAKVIAGGTDLLVQVRDNDKKIANVKYVVDLSHIKGLDYIKDDGDTIRMGALVTHDAAYKSEILNKYVSFLSAACNTVGSPQIRHSGTLGGNIGNASPAADSVPVMIALDAIVTVKSAGATREVPLASIFVKPYATNLAPNEMITEISFKKLPEGAKTAFIKLARRKALAISRMNIAVAVVTNNDGIVTDVRIAPGCIFPTPRRVSEAELLLIGKKPTDELIEAAGVKVSEVMIDVTGVRWSTEYKKPVIEAFTRRAIRQVLGGK